MSTVRSLINRAAYGTRDYDQPRQNIQDQTSGYDYRPSTTGQGFRSDSSAAYMSSPSSDQNMSRRDRRRARRGGDGCDGRHGRRRGPIRGLIGTAVTSATNLVSAGNDTRTSAPQAAGYGSRYNGPQSSGYDNRYSGLQDSRSQGRYDSRYNSQVSGEYRAPQDSRYSSQYAAPQESGYESRYDSRQDSSYGVSNSYDTQGRDGKSVPDSQQSGYMD